VFCKKGKISEKEIRDNSPLRAVIFRWWTRDVGQGWQPTRTRRVLVGANVFKISIILLDMLSRKCLIEGINAFDTMW